MFTNVAYLHNSLNDMVDTSKSLVVTSCGADVTISFYT